MQPWKVLGGACLASILLPLVSEGALADETYKFLNVTCVPEVQYFEVSATHIPNIGGSRDFPEHGLYGEVYEPDRRSITCDIGIKVTVEYRSTAPRATGMCGYGTKTFLDLWVGDVLIAKDIVFDDDCFSVGTTKLAVRGGGVLFLDMHPNGRSRGPQEIFHDFFLLQPAEGEFFTNRAHALPVTMKDIEARIEDLRR